MLTSVIDFSEEPLFPLKTLLSAKSKLLMKQSEDCFISARFFEHLIAKFYSLEVPFIVKSVEELMIHTYRVLLVNGDFLLFIKEYVGTKIDIQFIRELKDEIDKHSGFKNVRPVYVFISYENAFLNYGCWLVRRTGCYLLDRKELSDFIFQYSLSNKHWLSLQNKLLEIDNCTKSENFHERKVYRQAAEGFFMRVSDLINREITLKSDWYYGKNNTLTLASTCSRNQHSCSLIIANSGVFKTYIATTLFLESEDGFTQLQEYFINNIDLEKGYCVKHLRYNDFDENYLFELEGLDWYKSEREIAEKLVKLLTSIVTT